MSRKLAVVCSLCRRSFGGDEGLRKHRFLAGDRFRCLSDEDLRAKQWTRDRHGVWHRPVGNTAKPGSAPVRPTLWDADPSGGFGTPDHAPGRTRANDYSTSVAGAVAVSWRAGSQKARLLATYRLSPDGLTDEEAAAQAGIPDRSCYWKRCNELRQAGLITPTGQERRGAAGVPRIVCAVTDTGRAVGL